MDEEQDNKVFCVRGYAHNAHLNTKVEVVKIANESEVERVKQSLDSVIDCVLYGSYKSVNIINTARLRPEMLTREVSKKCVTLPAEYQPDGNCKPGDRPKEDRTAGISAAPSTHAAASKAAAPSTSTSHQSHAQAKKPASSGPSTKKSNSKFQPKLFFSHASASSKKSTETTSSVQSNPAVESSSGGVSVKSEKVAENETSPSKSSDKENEITKETRPKRSRVQMFSSSESDSEPDLANDSQKSKVVKHKKSEETSSNDQSTSGHSVKPVINKTGLVLDPEDLQNESDEELAGSLSGGEKSQATNDEKTKKRRRKKDSDAEHEDSQKSKKSKEISFGSVKAGDACSSMKYVDKTYLDDEGFLVTEKVLEEVPVTDTEAVERKKNTITKKKPSPTKHTKHTKPVPKQQSSLFSFFKKK